MLGNNRRVLVGMYEYLLWTSADADVGVSTSGDAEFYFRFLGIKFWLM